MCDNRVQFLGVLPDIRQTGGDCIDRCHSQPKIAPVLSKLPKLLLVSLLCLSLGLHWLLLQSVAWIGMVVSYSQTDSIGIALVKTFDGQHPCKLCKVVQAGKSSERKQDAQKPIQKLDPFCLSDAIT